MMSPSESQDLVRRLRSVSGLSQRAFAARAGTSGPTVAAYESGEKEPRLSTLHRLAKAADLDLDVRLAPADPGAKRRVRRERRSLALAAATAAAVERDFGGAKNLATTNIERMEGVVGTNVARQLLDEWRTTLERGPRSVRKALLDPSDHGHDMRQMTPFAGMLTDGERAAVLAVVDSLDALERAS